MTVLLRCLAVRIVVLLSALLLALPAHATRVALVIGNSAYASTPLKNPRNDPSAIAQLLKDRLGFDEVQLVLDGDEEKIKRAGPVRSAAGCRQGGRPF